MLLKKSLVFRLIHYEFLKQPPNSFFTEIIRCVLLKTQYLANHACIHHILGTYITLSVRFHDAGKILLISGSNIAFYFFIVSYFTS